MKRLRNISSNFDTISLGIIKELAKSYGVDESVIIEIVGFQFSILKKNVLAKIPTNLIGFGKFINKDEIVKNRVPHKENLKLKNCNTNERLSNIFKKPDNV